MAASSPPEPLLPPILLTLTAVTGLVDAACYLGLGHVLTANMTGNVVFLGFAIAGTQGLSVTRSGAALVAFLAGAVIGGRMARLMSGGPRHRWTGIAFGSEAALFFAATGIAIGEGIGFPEKPLRLYAAIVLTGLALGLRNATVRKLGVPELTTTVLTLTLAGLAADSALAGGSSPGWPRRTASVVTMVGGAALGTWLIQDSVALLLAVCGGVSALCALAAYFGVRGPAATTIPQGSGADRGASSDLES
jgi:uncharacterized membrane protein YoaK (UPF0700 family)